MLKCVVCDFMNKRFLGALLTILVLPSDGFGPGGIDWWFGMGTFTVSFLVFLTGLVVMVYSTARPARAYGHSVTRVL